MKTFPVPGCRSSQRGVALLVVLWGCTLAAITLGALAAGARVESAQARGQSVLTEMTYAARAGIDRAVFGLNARDDTARWMADGRPYAIRLGDTVVNVTVQDEDGKVNLNTATPELLERLIAATGLDPEEASRATEAIAAWGKRGHFDDNMLARGGFVSLEELYRVPGLDRSIVERILPALSLWAGQEPNLAHASPLVVAAVTGCSPEEAEAYVQRIRLIAPGRTNLPLPPGAFPGAATVSSGGIFNVVSRVRKENGPIVTVNATLMLKNEPGDPQAYRVVRWQESSGVPDNS